MWFFYYDIFYTGFILSFKTAEGDFVRLYLVHREADQGVATARTEQI